MALAPRFFGACRGPAARSAPVEEYKEKDAPFAYYFPPTPDGSRPGIYYANTYDLPSRTYSKLATTTYHEAVPGPPLPDHPRDGEPDLNVFRRLGSRMVGGAYVEGWGLYSERLADEMGLYRNEARAVRDARRPGLAGRPARRRHRAPRAALAAPAVDRLPAEAGLSETDAVIETDRYICWPGQALTYKIGQREIERLRRRARGARRRAASTCGRSTTRSSATGRCRSRRWPASCRTGWPRRPEISPGRAVDRVGLVRLVATRSVAAPRSRAIDVVSSHPTTAIRSSTSPACHPAAA